MPLARIGDTVVAYAVAVRPRRRHPAIQIQGGSVTVLVPEGFEPSRAEGLIRAHARWILKHLEAAPKAPPRRFVTGETFALVGRELGLVVDTALLGDTRVVLEGRRLRVTVPERFAPGRRAEAVRAALVAWYRVQAERLLPERVAHWAPTVGSAPRRLKVHEYARRWGYCRDDGLIAFNWRLVQAPLAVVDYVVVHELVHLRFPHHQKPFWNAVGEILPDWARHKAWLFAHGAELSW
ncbi:MAG: M48 family metallopeptidase [Actinomycetia bacterium]|nr:M48 family metallopeptidase [Actinomycetes bacterium]